MLKYNHNGLQNKGQSIQNGPSKTCGRQPLKNVK